MESETPKLTRVLSEVKRGKFTRKIPPIFREICLKAVKHAEERFGRPVYVVEIFQSMNKIS